MLQRIFQSLRVARPVAFARPSAAMAAVFPTRGAFRSFATEAGSGDDEPAKLFVANIAFSVSPDDLKAYLESLNCGPIGNVRFVADRETGRPRGIAYADLSKATLTKLLLLPNLEVGGRPLRIDIAAAPVSRPRPERIERPLLPPSTLLFIGNLSYESTEDQLRAAFPEAASVRLAVDRETRRPRGFGFVEFATVEAATAAQAKMDNADLGNGRPLKVNFAEINPPRPGGGAGGNGYRGQGSRPQGGRGDRGDYGNREQRGGNGGGRGDYGNRDRNRDF